MNPKRIIITGVMAISIALSGGVWSDDVSASSLDQYASYSTKENKLPTTNTPAKDDLTQILGVSDEDIYYAIYNGKSLADLAHENHVDVQKIIDLQIAEMTEQLNIRLASGYLTPNVYQAQKSELAEIITKSVYRDHKKST